MNVQVWRPPLIRLVALVMIGLCVLAPLALLILPSAPRSTSHTPEKLEAAMKALFLSVNVAPETPIEKIQPSHLAPVSVACASQNRYQGVPILQDLADNLNLLNLRLAGLNARRGVNTMLSGRYQVDTAAWMEHIRSRAVSCGHAAQALRRLAAPSGMALLMHADWVELQRRRPRGTPATGSVPMVQLGPSSLAQSDPWRGWPGCVWLGAGADAAMYVAPAGRSTWGKALCEQPGMAPAGTQALRAVSTPLPGAIPAASDPAWAIPPDLGTLIEQLDGVRLPLGTLYDHYAAQRPGGSNRRAVGRNEVDVGFNIHLTIDARAQRVAQQVAACYTGQAGPCTALGIDPHRIAAGKEPGAKALWERAGARMVGVAIVDVATGRIEALAGAQTACYKQQYDGPGHDEQQCPPLWRQPERRPEALLNHAAFTDYLPGSTVKPMIASVLFEDSGARSGLIATWLAESNSQAFNDELFCVNGPAGMGAAGCERPARVQRAAAALGWNTDCSTHPDTDCGQSDLLFGRALSAQASPLGGEFSAITASPLQRRAILGRIFTSADTATGGVSGFRLMDLPAIDPKVAQTCRAAGKWHASNCSSGALKPLVNEALGQGNARATPLGVATMMARLAAAANGATRLRAPHLVAKITDAAGQSVDTVATRIGPDGGEPLAGDVALPTKQDAARRIFEALAQASQIPKGTSRAVCQELFGARCAEAGKWFAGKTGTPSFAFDKLTYVQAASLCKAQPHDERCQQRPMKWYVAAYKTSSATTAHYDKVVAVLAERNFYTAGGDVTAALKMRVQDASDAYNIGAEIGMQIMNALVISPKP